MHRWASAEQELPQREGSSAAPVVPSRFSFNCFQSLAAAQEKSGDKAGDKTALQKPTHFVCFQGSRFAL